MGSIVGSLFGDCVRQFTAWGRNAIEDVDEAVARFLTYSRLAPLSGKKIEEHTRQTSPNHSDHVRVINIRLENERSNAVDDDNCLLIHRGDGLDKIIPIVPRVKVLAVTSILLDLDVTLARVRVDVHDGHFSILGS